MTLYCDLTREPECVGVCMTDGKQVVFTGTEVHAEPPEYRTLPLAVRLAEECDVHFRCLGPWSSPGTAVAGISPPQIIRPWTGRDHYTTSTGDLSAID